MAYVYRIKERERGMANEIRRSAERGALLHFRFYCVRFEDGKFGKFARIAGNNQ